MTAALTGTPGVGKTKTAALLRERGYSVIDLNDFIEKNGFKKIKDVPRDTYEVDISVLRNIFKEKAPVCDIVEGHLSHHLGLSPIIILRCSPEILRKRMSSKDWHQKKIEENLMAEMLDVILLESVTYSKKVYEIDTTEMTLLKVAGAVEDILEGRIERYVPGHTDWSYYIHNKEG